MLTISTRKTQIALDYAYRRCHDDPACSVFWVHADSETSFTQDYKSIARKLGLSESLSGKDLLRAVRAGIEANRCWLLVIDNADNLQLFGMQNASRSGDQDLMGDVTLNLSDFIPRGPVGTVLWTSRDKGVDSLVGPQRAIEVARMTDDEGIALLKTVGNIDDGELDSAAELLAELDYLALALSQAAVFMRRISMTIKEYLSRLADSDERWKVLQNSAHDPHRRQGLTNSILKTWDISIAQIRQENEMAFDVLHILAFSDNGYIPFNMLYQAVTLLRDERFTEDGSDDDNDNEHDNNHGGKHDSEYEVEEGTLQTAARLQEFSFMHRRASEDKSRAYEMHKLVQEAALYALASKNRQRDRVRYSKLAVRVVASLFPGREQEHWEEYKRYAIHAFQVANRVWLMGKDGLLWVRAMKPLHRIFRDTTENTNNLVEKTAYELGANLIAAYSWTEFAMVCNVQGRYKEAEKIFTDIIAIQGSLLGERDPDTIRTMAVLGTVYRAQKRYEKAEEMGARALTLHREVLGERHPNTLQSMMDLAAVYLAQKRYEKAEEMGARALTLGCEVLGERHPNTLQSMMTLVMVYLAQKRYEKAEEMGARALTLRREVLGERHPNTLQSMMTLAVVYLTQKRYEKAEEMGARALTLRREVLGERHPDTLQSMMTLTVIYLKQKRYEKAEEMRARALTLGCEVLGERHPDTF